MILSGLILNVWCYIFVGKYRNEWYFKAKIMVLKYSKACGQSHLSDLTSIIEDI